MTNLAHQMRLREMTLSNYWTKRAKPHFDKKCPASAVKKNFLPPMRAGDRLKQNQTAWRQWRESVSDRHWCSSFQIADFHTSLPKRSELVYLSKTKSFIWTNRVLIVLHFQYRWIQPNRKYSKMPLRSTKSFCSHTQN
jgi:hypothetical protein